MVSETPNTNEHEAARFLFDLGEQSTTTHPPLVTSGRVQYTPSPIAYRISAPHGESPNYRSLAAVTYTPNHRVSATPDASLQTTSYESALDVVAVWPPPPRPPTPRSRPPTPSPLAPSTSASYARDGVEKGDMFPTAVSKWGRSTRRLAPSNPARGEWGVRC